MDDDQRSVSYVPSIGDEEEWVDLQDAEQTGDLIGGDMFEHHDGETFEHSLDFGISSFEPGRASELQQESTMPVGVELPVASLEPAPLTGNSWNTMLAHAFASNMNVAATLPLPWETGTMRDIFSDSVLPAFAPTIFDTTNLSQPDVARQSLPSDVLFADNSDAVRPAYMSAVRSLKDLDFVEGKKAQLTLATSKWLEILSIDWRCSSVGEQAASDMQADPSGDLAEQSLRAVFGVKSPSTLLKRAASLRQYVVWFQKECCASDTYVSPFPLTEHDVWRYFLHLREVRKESKKGFTVCSTFLETLRFCKYVIGMYWIDAILASKRLLGFAAVERQEKGPLCQAPSLEVEHLLKLHEILERGDNDVDRIGAGAFLCAIYARARWSDLRFVHHIKYDGYKRNATLDLYTSEHKTSSVGLRREQFLPLVIPSEGIVQTDWIGVFIDLCHRQGFDWTKVPYGPLLPAPKGNNDWCARPLSTSEAAAWLRKLLEGCQNVDKIRAHSMKVTLCVWAARAGFSKEHRATLSHHATALHGSDIVYSRDVQTAAIRKLQMLLKKVRIGLDPGAADERVREVTARFDAGFDSVVRTPVFNQQAPQTPLPPSDAVDAAGKTNVASGISEVAVVVERGLNQGQERTPTMMTECKTEAELESLCEAALNVMGGFSADIQAAGLIEIDSSSGSSSDSGSSEDSDDSSAEHFTSAVPKPAYTEHVPVGLCYHVHRKSRILHKAKEGQTTTACKTRLSGNFQEIARVLHFKYPKCMRCFVWKQN